MAEPVYCGMDPEGNECPPMCHYALVNLSKPSTTLFREAGTGTVVI